MTSLITPPILTADPLLFATSFDREPFGFEHNLAELGLFAMDNLRELASRYIGHPADYFIASGARSADTVFYSVPQSESPPVDALAALDTTPLRILLKRPENFDAHFAELQNVLFDKFIDPSGDLRPSVERLNSSIFISSAATITPFHFDPEITFFFQIEGTKIYQLYSPLSLPETELEDFYRHGVLNIGQIDLAGRDEAQKVEFELAGGRGLHQPQNTPHWVETRNERSISYAISFETEQTRAAGRTRAFNYYLRRLGHTPSKPDLGRSGDALKAKVVEIAFPIRTSIKAHLRRLVLGRSRG